MFNKISVIAFILSLFIASNSSASSASNALLTVVGGPLVWISEFANHQRSNSSAANYQPSADELIAMREAYERDKERDAEDARSNKRRKKRKQDIQTAMNLYQSLNNCDTEEKRVQLNEVVKYFEYLQGTYLNDALEPEIDPDDLRWMKKLNQMDGQIKSQKSKNADISFMLAQTYHYRRDLLNNPPSILQVVDLYLIAANQGHSGAMYELGKFYEYGQTNFVQPDMIQAIMWYQKAAAANDNNAQMRLTAIRAPKM